LTWAGRLSPILQRISTGDFNGKHKQFADNGNFPDPASIDISSGVVKYEIVKYWYFIDEETQWTGNEYYENVFPKNFEDIYGIYLF
jgi:hypothetical protein